MNSCTMGVGIPQFKVHFCSCSERVSPEEVQSKLGDILKEMRALFKEDLKISSDYLFTPGSRMTLYDPDYAVKYWKGHGVTIEQPRETKREDLTSPSKKSSSDSSDSS